MKIKPRLLRITTVPISLKILLRGQFIFFHQQGFEVLTVSADGPEVADIKREGVEHIIVPMTRTITLLQDFVCLYKLILIIKKFKPDIVHTHTPKAGLLGMLAAWLCNVPVRLHTVAGLPLMEMQGVKRWIIKQTERITYACAHRIYPNSRGLFDFIIKEIRIRPLKLKIIGSGSSNGIDVEYFSRTPQLEQQASQIRLNNQIPDNEIVFCFVGRLVMDKGITELVRSFEVINNKVPSWLLLVGSFEEQLDPLPPGVMVSIKGNKRILATGFQKDVRAYMMASNIFVFPSYREGFPNVVMQAACLNIPSIVSDINGCNELIENNKTGLVIPPKNEEALQTAMEKLAANEDERKEMSIKAKDFVSGHFDQRHFWNELHNEYSSLLRKL